MLRIVNHAWPAAHQPSVPVFGRKAEALAGEDNGAAAVVGGVFAMEVDEAAGDVEQVFGATHDKLGVEAFDAGAAGAKEVAQGFADGVRAAAPLAVDDLYGIKPATRQDAVVVVDEARHAVGDGVSVEVDGVEVWHRWVSDHDMDCGEG